MADEEIPRGSGGDYKTRDISNAALNPPGGVIVKRESELQEGEAPTGPVIPNEPSESTGSPPTGVDLGAGTTTEDTAPEPGALPSEPPAESPSSEAVAPWAGFTTDDELDQYVQDNTLSVPKNWQSKSVAQKKDWLDKNVEVEG